MELYIDIKLTNNEKYLIQYSVFCNRHKEYASDIINSTLCSYNISGAGIYSIKIILYNAENKIKIKEFITRSINYNKYNYQIYRQQSGNL